MEETSTPQPVQPTGAFPRFMGPFALLSYSWGAFKQHWRTLVGIQLIPVIIAIIAAGLGILGTTAVDKSHVGLGVAGGLIAFILLIVAIVATIWSTVALLVAVRDSNEKIGIGEAFKRAKGKLGAYFWISLISGFITLGGFILLIVPGIIFAGWFALASFVFITEGDQGMNALMKSKEYVRGFWGAVFGRILFIGVVLWLITIIVQLIVGLLHIQIVSSVVSWLLELVIAPIAVLYGYRMYTNLREVKGQVTPTQKGRGWFVGIGIFGVIGIPIIIILLVGATIFSLKNHANNANLDAQFQNNIQKALENQK